MIVAIDRALERLEKHCPLSKPIYIEGISKNKGYGFAYRNGNTFLIEIATDISSATQVDTLIHEWAHCLRGNGRHNDLFGIEWARCYCAVYFNGSEQKSLNLRMSNDNTTLPS